MTGEQAPNSDRMLDQHDLEDIFAEQPVLLRSITADLKDVEFPVTTETLVKGVHGRLMQNAVRDTLAEHRL
jgi:hypothetical protein